MITKDYLIETLHNFVNQVLDKRYQHFVTPEMFGAKGDGVTDDTLAFTRAFAQSNHVVCNSNKTYYFAGTVDASQLIGGILDVNYATLKNFHIRVCLKADNTTAYFASRFFVFKNATLNSYNYKPENWETPAIQCGAYVHIENVKGYNTPYLLAIPNVYRDYMIFRDINIGYSKTLFESDTFNLDAINLIKADGTFVRVNLEDIANIPTGQTDSTTSFAGDGWIIERVNECRAKEGSDYAFCHFLNNRPITFIGCIQTKFVIGQATRATFIDCHWEGTETYPEFYTLSNATTHTSPVYAEMVFNNCYFYNSYVLETDNRNVVYEHCFFRKDDMSVASADREYTLAETLNNTDYYDMKCRLIDCDFGCNVKIDTELFKLYKALPKGTRTEYSPTSMNDSTNGIVANKTLTPSASSHSALYPMLGTYSYKIISYATGTSKFPHQMKEFTRVVESLNNEADVFMHFKTGYGGGWWFEVYRTLPDTTIQKARFWFDPNNYGYPTASYKVRDNGRYCTFVLVHSSTALGVIEMEVIVPWITVSSIPTQYASPLVYEKNGVLVSTNNQKISGLTSTYKYAQVNDNFEPDFVTRSEMEQYIQEVDTLPTASASNAGQSYLYTGTTTATYQKGGIYECQQTSVDTYEWKLTNVPVAVVKDVVANSTDFADFKSKIALI